MMLYNLITIIILITLTSPAQGGPPNIIHILVDDFGWEQVGYHHDENSVNGKWLG